MLALGGCDHRLIESQHAPALFEHAAQLFPKSFDAITVHDVDCPAIKAVVGAPANGVLHGAADLPPSHGVNPERHAKAGEITPRVALVGILRPIAAITSAVAI